MPDVARVLREKLQAAFDTIVPGADPTLRPSDRADFQANGALALAKQVGRPPRDIAEDVAAAVSVGGVCAVVEVSGPGFINLTLSDGFVAEPARGTCRPTRASAWTGPSTPRPSSSTTPHRTWPRRCTSGTCAAR